HEPRLRRWSGLTPRLRCRQGHFLHHAVGTQRPLAVRGTRRGRRPLGGGDRDDLRSQQGRHLRPLRACAAHEPDAAGQARARVHHRSERRGDAVPHRLERAARSGAGARDRCARDAVPLPAGEGRSHHRDQADRLLPGLIPGGSMRRLSALAGCFLCLVIAAAPAHAEWYSRTEAIMDTRIYVELWDTDPKHANAAIDAVMAEMHHVDDVMSDFKPESQLSQINEHAAQHPVVVSPELYDLIKLSTHYSQITGGAFDITMESVWRLYHFRRRIHPTDAQIQALLP